MTDEQREAERIKSLASAVYRALDAAAKDESYIRELSARHGEHPAFAEYMREMMLTDRLAEFLARPKMKRG